MPELPEVETTRRGIEPHLNGQVVRQLVVRQPRLRWPIPDDLGSLIQNRPVESVVRRAKYLLIGFANGTVILHLGMSGSLRIIDADEPAMVHDHVDFVLANGRALRYTDPRRFGCVLWQDADADTHGLLASLGPEPLSDEFTGDTLYRRSRGRKAPVKTFIMDNKVVVGVGNIYANEALFRARINPKIAAGRIGLSRYKRLVLAVKEILAGAIEAGGSSLRDFVNSDGKPGYFQQQYWVYGRTGQPCRQCGATIVQIKQAQRSSFYCSKCQR